MQIRLLHIGLTFGGVTHAEGAVLTAGPEGDIPLELANARLAARTAERADVAETPPALAAALAHVEEGLIGLQPVLEAVLITVESEADAVAALVHERLRAAFAGLESLGGRLHELTLRAWAIAGGDNSSGVEQLAAHLAHNQEVAGSSPAPAPNFSEGTADAPASGSAAEPLGPQAADNVAASDGSAAGITAEPDASPAEAQVGAAEPEAKASGASKPKAAKGRRNA